jgi:hypothetical protein
VAKGPYEVANRVRGFVRGPASYRGYLFVATSHMRKPHTFGDPPLAQEGGTMCGVTVFHLGIGGDRAPEERAVRGECIQTCATLRNGAGRLLKSLHFKRLFFPFLLFAFRAVGVASNRFWI